MVSNDIAELTNSTQLIQQWTYSAEDFTCGFNFQDTTQNRTLNIFRFSTISTRWRRSYSGDVRETSSSGIPFHSLCATETGNSINTNMYCTTSNSTRRLEISSTFQST